MADDAHRSSGHQEEPDPDGHAGPPPSATAPDGSGEPAADEPNAAERAAADHDVTGLDLARRIAQSARAASSPRRRPRRPTAATGAPAPNRSTDRDPQLLGAALDRLIANQGWQARTNLQLLLSRWSILVGPVNAEHSQPESFTDGTLTIRTDSTAWATSLRTITPQILARLNEQLGTQTVTFIRVVGPRAPTRRYGPRSVRGRGPRDTYG